MCDRKCILLFCEEKLTLESLNSKLSNHSAFQVIVHQEKQSLGNIIHNLPLYCDHKIDLVSFICYSVSPNDLSDYVQQIKDIYKSSPPPRILFVEKHANIFSKSKENLFEVMSFSDLFLYHRLENAFDRLLGTFSTEYNNRVRIADRTNYIDNISPEPISTDLTPILDRLRSSHMFAGSDHFPQYHVQYNSENTCDHEQIYDSRIIDPSDRFIDTIGDFHNQFIINDQRVTYLLIGHRGCGKSSFLRYYFQHYQPFTRLNRRYIFVDFINYYGMVVEASKLQFDIISALHNYIIKSNNAELISKFPTLSYLFSPDIASLAIDQLAELGIPLSSVITLEQQYNIDNMLGDFERINICKCINNDSNISDTEALNLYRIQQSNTPWKWLMYLWKYMQLDSANKPIKYFTKWIIDKAFNSNLNIKHASVELFNDSHMKAWLNDNLKDGLKTLDTMSIDQLGDIATSFLEAAAANEKVCIILDNADQITAPYAESRFFQIILSHIARAYKYIKLIVSVRPNTYHANKDSINNTKQPFDFPHDTAAYAKYWLHTVKLDRIINKRLQVLQSDNTYNRKQHDFIHLLNKLVGLPVVHDKRNIKNPSMITDLLSGVCGNNIREGLELFADTIKAWYPTLSDYHGSGLLRKINQREECIAEHIAIREIFLAQEGAYFFKNNLINLFHIPSFQKGDNYTNLLIIRILEILNKQKHIMLKDIYHLLEGIGYKHKYIKYAIEYLHKGRLLSIQPYTAIIEPNNQTANVSSRYRGDFYYNSLLSRLSYIQMVYFMMYLPMAYADSFSYPKLPSPNELRNLVNNFLHSLWIDIANEQHHANPKGIELYEQEIVPLIHIHQLTFNAYLELERIIGQKHISPK
jgi:hypothetical protein